MSWIEVAWTVMASWSLALGLVHLFVWMRQRSHAAYLWFFLVAACVAAFGVFELRAMRAQTPEQYAIAARWAQVPLTGVVLAILAFVHSYFRTGRIGLAYAAAGFRLMALVANFATGETVMLREITAIVRVPLGWGAAAAVPVGDANPWTVITQIGNLFLIAYVSDATIALWRRGSSEDRRRAVLVGGALVVCITVAVVMGVLIFSGAIRAPTPLTACFLLVVVAMSSELGWDLIRSAQLARELRESERRIDLAAQSVRLAFWSWSPGDSDVWLSAQGRDLFGIAESGRLDLDGFLASVHGEERVRLRTALLNAPRDAGAFEQEVRVASPGGAVHWLAVRGQFDRGGSGAPGVLRGVAIDVTARRQLEREAAQRRDELAHLSRVATVGALSGSLAHEINQPLMGILSNAQAAQSFLESGDAQLEEVRAILADIVEDDKRAGDVIRRMRALLKKGEVQHTQVDMPTVIDEVLRLMRNDLINRDVSAVVACADAMPPVLGDRIQLQQVVLNLVINACDAMEGVSPRETTIDIRRGSKELEVSVSDRGTGIPSADLEHIFEPFVTAKEHGMGIGLSVCRAIVAAHGGRLWAENNARGGATFRFTLPIAGAVG